MGGRIQREIQQTKPLASLEEEIFVNLQRSAEVLLRRLAEVLKPAELTPTQYNVMRILRGSEPDGLPCREIGSRMVTHDPDITRLLDRLEARGLVGRWRCDKDRRVVYTRITDGGLQLLRELDGTVERFLVEQLGPMGKRLQLLGELLDEACAPKS